VAGGRQDVEPEPDISPQRIGGFRVLRRLASGATTDVLLARAEGSSGPERVVALKVLLQPSRSDPAFESLFAREAAAYARLSHPAIVQLYDFFAADGQLVLVLEYIDGLPLHKLRATLSIGGERLEDSAAIFIGSRIFAALAAAHSASDPESGEFSPVIHRDINPSNVLVPWDGRVKVSDFGMGKLANAQGDMRMGFVKGTYGYAAPEQVRGEAVTVRADVYAATIVLWELLTRRKAIQRGSLPEAEVRRAMANPDFPSLDSLRPDLNAEVREAVRRGLEPDPDRRTLTAEEMEGILRKAMNGDEGRVSLTEAISRVRPMSALDGTTGRPGDSVPSLSPRTKLIVDPPPTLTMPSLSGAPAPPDPLPPREVDPESPLAPSTPEKSPPLSDLEPTLVSPTGPPPPQTGTAATATPEPIAEAAAPPPALDGGQTTSTPSPVPVAPAAVAPVPTAPVAVVPVPVAPVAAAPAGGDAPAAEVAVGSEPSHATPASTQSVESASHDPPPVRRKSSSLMLVLGVALGLALIGVGGFGLYAHEQDAAPITAASPADSASAPASTQPASPLGATGGATSSAGPLIAPAQPSVGSTPMLETSATTPASASAASVPAPRPVVAGRGQGILVTDSVPGGHRIFVDGRIVGESPSPAVAPCGTHSVQVGSAGTARSVQIPCGASISVSP
jgi:serine/threonine protein kinase